MPHPLDKVVPFEERLDGIYIKVGRDANKAILSKAIKNAIYIAANIYNQKLNKSIIKELESLQIDVGDEKKEKDETSAE